MNNSIFRKKSLERISSPEQLTDYIRASNPSMWIVLATIVILLVGICVWGILGRLDTKLTVVAKSENGTLICYIKESDIDKIKNDMKVTINGEEYDITEISVQPIAVGEDFGDYAMHIGELKEGEWVYTIITDAHLEDKVYSAEIVIDSVSPMSFVFN